MTAPIHWTVRDEKRAGSMRNEVLSKFGLPKGHLRLTVWIHGFNTSEYSAADTWEISYRQVMEITKLNRLNGTVWFFWPGDASRNPAFSAAGYFAQIPDAVTAGRLLAQYITSISVHNPGLKVDLVAHSLGCRVALEAARHLSSTKTPVRTLLLFAAAVPEGLCLPGNQYDGPLAQREQILFSQSDTVLKRWFPLGQALARRTGNDIYPGHLTEAVGYRGGPSDRWKRKQEARDYEHGDYWTGEESLDFLGTLYGRPPFERNQRERPNRRRRPAYRIQRTR
jgi:pimeloyl-ACP methyl ester carboxylesterase